MVLLIKDLIRVKYQQDGQEVDYDGHVETKTIKAGLKKGLKKMKLIRKTEIVEEKSNTYWDMTIPGNHNYVLGNGNVVHNTGLGFSVERQSIAKLPEIEDSFHDTDTVIKVKDSKMGWAVAFKELLAMLWAGQIPKWDLTELRPVGAPLKTFGGRSSGPEPLDRLFKHSVATFRKAAGRKLTSVECHDLMCFIAEIVVVGGVRRAALISLSNLSDDRMRSAKMGQWWLENGQRSLSNNSIAFTEKPEMEAFMKEWLSLYESRSGERGIFNRKAAIQKMKSLGRRDWKKFEEMFGGLNPCAEIFLRSCGFCNLSEAIARSGDTLKELKEKIETATILGTFQSTLTNFKFLRSVWKKNAEEERLLGVSLTGIMDHAVLSGSEGKDKLEKWLDELRETAIETNKIWSEILGINQSVAITCVKPSGCSTPDTKIKTTDADMSMKALFERAGVDLTAVAFEMTMSGQKDRWIEVAGKNMPKVYDENNELQDITKLYINGVAPVIEIEFEDNKTYRFTPNHMLLTTNGWKRVDELTDQDDVISY